MYISNDPSIYARNTRIRVGGLKDMYLNAVLSPHEPMRRWTKPETERSLKERFHPVSFRWIRSFSSLHPDLSKGLHSPSFPFFSYKKAG